MTREAGELDRDFRDFGKSFLERLEIHKASKLEA